MVSDAIHYSSLVQRLDFAHDALPPIRGWLLIVAMPTSLFKAVEGSRNALTRTASARTVENKKSSRVPVVDMVESFITQSPPGAATPQRHCVREAAVGLQVTARQREELNRQYKESGPCEPTATTKGDVQQRAVRILLFCGAPLGFQGSLRMFLENRFSPVQLVCVIIFMSFSPRVRGVEEVSLLFQHCAASNAVAHAPQASIFRPVNAILVRLVPLVVLKPRSSARCTNSRAWRRSESSPSWR